MTVCVLLFIPINHLSILSAAAMAAGLYLFFLGFHVLVRNRLLLTTPASKIGQAPMGPVEVGGVAAGPFTMPSPITGEPCFLYQTTAWRQRQGSKQEWEKVADETLQLPFFIADSTGQLLIEPSGSDLDLHPSFRGDYTASLLASEDIPQSVSGFFSRHGITPNRDIRVEERLIKPDDALFIAGTITANPGVQVPLLAARSDLRSNARNDIRKTDSRNPTRSQPPKQSLAPQVIRLAGGPTPAVAREMTQQAKIAAALTRAGVTGPEPWSAAGGPQSPSSSVTVEENVAPPTIAAEPLVFAPRPSEDRPNEDKPVSYRKSDDFNLTPPVVLMKGANDPTFVISFRSRKEFVSKLTWKSAAMVSGGTTMTLLGLCMLWA